MMRAGFRLPGPGGWGPIMPRAIRTCVWLAAVVLAAGCYGIADYDEFPGWPDDVPRDTDLELDTGELDTGEPDTDEDDTGEPDTDSIDTETDIDTDSGPPTDGSTWCWMVAPAGEGQLAVIQIDMDTGTWFEQGTYGAADSGITESYHTAGIGLLDDVMVMSGYTGNDFNWIELDMGADTVTKGEISNYTVSVGSDGSRLVTLCEELLEGPFGGFCFYDDFEALDSLDASEIVSASTWASRLCTTEERAYTAWHSTNEIEVFDIGTGEQLYTIALEGWDGWVWGMSVVGDVLHLASGGFEERIARFDHETGDLLDEVYVTGTPYSHPPTGLWCESY